MYTLNVCAFVVIRMFVLSGIKCIKFCFADIIGVIRWNDFCESSAVEVHWKCLKFEQKLKLGSVRTLVEPFFERSKVKVHSRRWKFEQKDKLGSVRTLPGMIFWKFYSRSSLIMLEIWAKSEIGQRHDVSWDNFFASSTVDIHWKCWKLEQKVKMGSVRTLGGTIFLTVQQ